MELNTHTIKVECPQFSIQLQPRALVVYIISLIPRFYLMDGLE